MLLLESFLNPLDEGSEPASAPNIMNVTLGFSGVQLIAVRRLCENGCLPSLMV